MTTPELIEFVKKEISLGVNRDIIKGKLKTQGWNDLDIIEAFNIINQTPISPLAHEEIITQQFEMSNSINPINPVGSINNFNSIPYIQTKSTNKIIKLLAVILIPVILISGLAIAYGFGYFTNFSNLFSNISDLSENNKSFSYELNLNLDASKIKLTEENNNFDLEKFKNFNFIVKGVSDFSDKENHKLDNSLLFTAGDIEAGFDLRMINKSIYFSLTKAPDLGFFSLKPFENKWVVFPMNDDSEVLKNNPLSSFFPINSDLVSDLTDEQKKQISDLMKNTKFIKITKKHFPVMIDGVLSYHFNFDLNKEEIISFLKNTTEYMKNLDKYNSELLNIEESDYNKVFHYIKTFHGEAWIGIFDKLPRKILINMDLFDSENIDNGIAKLILSVVYRDWNEPVKVEIPSSAVTVEELMSGVMVDMLGSDIKTDGDKSEI
jgi:hypothetical protein